MYGEDRVSLKLIKIFHDKSFSATIGLNTLRNIIAFENQRYYKSLPPKNERTGFFILLVARL
jgi:hypothetical protein